MYIVEVKNWNNARNFIGPVINYLTFNNGYHTIHHMYPSMHWSRLDDISCMLASQLPSSLCLTLSPAHEPNLLPHPPRAQSPQCVPNHPLPLCHSVAAL